MAEQIRVRVTGKKQESGFAHDIRTWFNRLVIIAAALLLWQGNAYATHAMGGELTYSCLGNGQYLVTLNFYRDCNGVAAPTNCNNGLSFNVSSTACGANFSQCFGTNPTVQIITPICPTETDRCISATGTYGVEKYTYTKIIDLSAYSGCGGSDWLISWSLCCRNNAITSLNDPGNRELYLNARLNNSTGLCNSSPSFTNSPTAFYCLGQPISYNPGAVDVDGDSLVYALIPARTAGAVNIPYNANYSATQPIRNAGGAGAVILDPHTGTMTVTPSVLQVAVVTYQVTEYRHGVVVGVVTRDVQFVVRACTGNSAPTATGINGTSTYTMQVCAGTPVSFTVNSNDANTGQVVTMGWNSGIPSATFTTSGTPFPTGTFNWTPTVANIGNNTFTVHVQDNGCPLIGSNDFGFSINVTPPATNADAGADISVCGTSATLAGVLPYAGVQGTWSVVSGSGTFANSHSSTTTVTGLAQGANVFQWSVDYLTCGIRTDQVTVTAYNPAQAAASAGPAQQLCLPTNTATLAGNPAVIPAVGTWTLVGGTGTITTPNSPTSTVTALGVGVNRFRWTINNGPCGAPTQSEVTITVFSNTQAAANAGPDIAICSPTSSVTMNGNAVTAPATGTWTLVSGTGTITSPSSRNTTITGLPVGVHVFRWSISNGPCTPGATNDDVTVTVYSASSPNADAGADQSVCTPSTATLSGSTPTFPATGAWTVVSGSGTIASPTSPSTTVSGLGIGNNVFQWTVSNGPCANGLTSDQVTVTAFDQTVSGSNAGPDQSFCTPTTSAVMAANAPTAPAQGTWTLVSGTGTIANIHNAATSISGLSIGENVFRWAISNGPCPVNPPNDLVSIFIFDANAPGANAGPDQQLCTPSTSTTLAANAAVFPATGHWTVVTGSGTFANTTNPVTVVSGLAVGVNTFRWALNNGPCSNPLTQDDVSITVFSGANPVANAGPDQNLCTPTTSATLAGSTLIAPATGTWTLVSGAGTIVAPGSPTSQVTGLGVGDNVFRWTVSNGPCANGLTSDDVRIRLFNIANAAANAGPDQSICANVNSTVMAGSPVIYPATGTWTLVSGTGIIVTPASPTTAVSGLGVGENVFRWSVSNGTCPGANTNDLVSIFVYSDAHVVVTAGPDQSICIPTAANTVNVTGTAPTFPATGHWTLVSGSGTVLSSGSPSTTIVNMGIGVNVFQWTIDNGPCILPNNSAQVTIQVYDATTPTANAGPDQSLCTPITSTTLAGSTLNGPATGHWTLVSGTGVITNPANPTSGVTGLSLGANVFQWSVDNGPCAAPTSDQVTISLFNGNAQQANAGADQELCDTNGNTILAANAAVAPATGSWSVTQGTATFANATNPSTSVSGLSVGVNILAWSLNNGACGTSTDQVQITVYDHTNPVSNAGPDQQLCTPTTSTSLAGSNVIAPATGTWTLISGTGNIVSPNARNTQVNGLGVGNNVFRWTVSNGPCANGLTTDEVTISVFNGSALAANAGPDQDLCTPTTSATLAANSAAVPAQGTWTGPAGVTFSNTHAANAIVSGLSIGDNILTWTINNGTCGTTTDQVRIRVFAANNPVANAGPDQQLCTPTTSATMAGSALTYPATGVWTLVSGTGTITNPASPNTTITGMAIGANIFRWTVSNGPCSNGTTSDEVTITVFDQTVSGSNAGPDQQLCTPVTSTTMAASAAPSPAQGTWTLVSGSGIITSVNSPSTTITGLAVGENIFRWSVSNGACPVNPPNDLVSIFVFDHDNPVANAGPDQSLCTPTSTTTLAGSSVTFPATGTWTVVSGTGTITSPNSPTSTVTGLGVGVTVLEWSVNNGPCADPLTTDRMSIFIYDANNAASNAGPDQSLCTPEESATLAANTPTFPATGHWLVVQGPGHLTDPTDPNTTVTGLAVGENIFQWAVQNGPCANGLTYDLVSIFLFDSSTPNAAAGPDQSLCTPLSFTTLAGSPVTYPGTGTWTRISGTGAFQDSHSPTTIVSGLSVGVNIFRWSVSNGLCSSSSDDVAIYLYDANNPVAAAGPDQELCTPGSTVVMAGSTITFPATGTWTLVSGSGTITDPASPTTGISDLAVGTSIFAWTVNNGPCANGTTSDTMAVRVFDRNNPPAAAGPDQELCTPTTSATLAGSSVIAPALGTWTISQGAGVFSDIHQPNATVSGLAVGVNVLRWTVSNGPCENALSFDEVTITLFDRTNPVANAGPDQRLCTPATNTIMAGSAIIFPAVGTWTRVSGTGNIADINSPTTAISGLSIGENVFQWAVTNGPCGGPTTDLVSIFVYDATNPLANAGAHQQVCTPLTGTTFAGSSVTFPATGQWTLISGQGTIVDSSDPGSAVTALGVGENVFEWTVDNGPCSGVTTDQVSIFLFDLNAPPAAAGPDQSFCTPTSTATMAGNTPAPPAIGVWTVTQGTGVFDDVNDPSTGVSGLTVGENILTWTINNGLCGISHDDVSIFIYDANNPAANAGPDQAYCTPQDSTYLQGNTPIFPAQGTWSTVGGAGLFADVHDPASKVVGMTIGQNTYVWTMNNGPCPGAITTDTVTIVLFSDSTAAAYAGEDFENCLPNTTIFLNANAAQPPATGTWSILNGPGTIVDPSDPHTEVDDLALGITTFLWTLNNGPCPNNGLLTDTVSVSVYDPFGPVANAGPDISNCTPLDSALLGGNTPLFPAQGTWAIVQGSGTIADVHDPNSAITGLSVGIDILTWTIYNGDCGFGPPTVDTVAVQLFDADAPQADAGPDQAWCTPLDTITLAGNDVVFPGTGTWALVSGSGTPADASDPHTTLAGLAVGDNLFTWTINNGPCGTSVDSVHIVIYDSTLPSADAGPAQSLCTPSGTTALAATPVPFPASGSWSVVSGNGTFTDPGDANTNVSGFNIGVSQYAWTIDNGPCGTSADTVSITLFDGSITSASAGPDQDLCSPVQSTTLAATPVSAPATATWSIISGAGTLSDPSDPGAVLNGLIPGQTVLVWTISNGPCGAAPITDTVTVTVFDGQGQAAANAGPDQSFCEPGTVDADMFANEAVFPAVGTWSASGGTGAITDPSDHNTSVTGLGFGASTFTWTIDNGVCGTTSDDMVISVFDSSVPPASAGPDQALCQDTTTSVFAAVPATSTATGHWELVSGHGDIQHPDQADAEVTDLRPGTNIFRWVVDNGACGTTSDSILIVLRDCSILVVPDAFSPNGDGVNDTYVIQGLEYYPNNSFQVFNRWGSKVYERNPYTNTWTGKNEGKLSLGSDLPEGTYYFILDPGNDKDVITGYIYLRR